jgi:hypothetical protein
MSDKQSKPKFYLEIIADIRPDLAVDFYQQTLRTLIVSNEEPHIRKISPIEETCSMLREDPELYKAYRDNISVSFQDAWFKHTCEDNFISTHQRVRIIADQAAQNFLNLWISAPTPLGRNHAHDIIPQMEKDLLEGPYRPATKEEISMISKKERLDVPDPKADIEQKEKKSTHQEEYVDEIMEKIKRAKEHPLLEYAIKHLDTMAEGCTDKDLKVMETTKLLLTMLISEDIDNTQMYASLSLAQAVMWKYYKRPNNSYAEMSSKEKAFREKITGGDFENEQAENSIENKA